MRAISSWLVLSAFLALALAQAPRKGLKRPLMGIQVYTRATTVNLRQVSAAASTFIFDGYFQYAWRDDSLFQYADDGAPYTQIIGESSNYYSPITGPGVLSGTMPYPLVTPSIRGQVAPAPTLTQAWAVSYGAPAWLSEAYNTTAAAPDASVWVQGRMDYTGLTILAPQDLRNFPLDVQTVQLHLTNTNLPFADMRLVPTQDMAAPFPGGSLNPPASPDGYTMVGTAIVLGNSTDGGSTIALRWTLQRIPDFFFNRFVLPLVLVNVLIISLNGANPATRLMAAFTMMGTVVSFLFVSGQSVPQLPYSTRLDRFFTFQFFMAAIIGLANMYSSNRTDRMKSHVFLSLLEMLPGCGAKAKAPEKKKDDEPKKEDKGAAAAGAPAAKEGAAAAPPSPLPGAIPTSAEVILNIKEPVSGMSELALARAMFERKLKMDQKAADKAAADKKKADEDKAKSKIEAEKNQAQLTFDFGVSFGMVVIYVITVPCIFYA